MQTKIIDKYLQTYAESIVTQLNDVSQHLQTTYGHVLVIPLHDEPLDCLHQVFPSNLHNSLIVVVVNAAADHDIEVAQRTQAFLHQYQAQAALTPITDHSDNTLLLVDCCTAKRQLPAKQGVGLARKIGGDLALACIAARRVVSPWIHYTDADARLPEDYFDAVPTDVKAVKEIAALLYPFTHQPSHTSILQYEISLRYYVTQLARAGSPYAFHTIGSLMTINAHHYAGVRGFPKRKAAEDFYMLNKLAKVGTVVSLQKPVVVLSSRISDRVPFGTGAAMQQLATEPELLFYHPVIFERLRRWLNLWEPLWCDQLKILDQGLAGWWQSQGGLDEHSLQALLTLGLDKTLPKAYQQCHNFERFRYFMQVWFDAFRTLKFIHYLRDYELSSVSLTEVMTGLKEYSLTVERVDSVEDLQRVNDGLHMAEHSQDA